MVKRKKVSVSQSHGRTILCRGHMDEHASITAIRNTVSTSRPHDKNTASWISHPCKRVIDSRIRQHLYITPGNSSRKTTFNLIGSNQPNREDSTRSEEVESTRSGVRLTGTSNFANAEAQKPAATAAGHCMDRQWSQQKSRAPATHEYQTGVSVYNTPTHEARRSGTWMSLTWQLTIRIGYDDPDRLITYPDAHNLSR